MILGRPIILIIPWFSLTENIKDNIAVNFIVAIIYVLHQMSAQYKKHKQHTHKIIVYKYIKFLHHGSDNYKVYLGQVRFLRT